jgi:hypothetical protein
MDHEIIDLPQGAPVRGLQTRMGTSTCSHINTAAALFLRSFVVLTGVLATAFIVNVKF